MEYGSFTGIIGGAATVVAFIATWVKIGTQIGRVEQRLSGAEEKIEMLGAADKQMSAELFSIQLENAKMSATISSDLTWIKSKLDDITKELGRKDSHAQA